MKKKLTAVLLLALLVTACSSTKTTKKTNVGVDSTNKYAVEDTEAKESILSLKSGYPQRPTAYYGLRGSRKTVLLNTIEEFALENNIIYEHIEIMKKRFLLQTY